MKINNKFAAALVGAVALISAVQAHAESFGPQHEK